MSETHVEDRPHNSLRGQVSEAEWDTRVALAAGCRITQHFGWNDTIRNHLTARVPDEPDKFLMNPVGLRWDEITASDFLKVDFEGNCHTDSPYKPGTGGAQFSRRPVESLSRPHGLVPPAPQGRRGGLGHEAGA